MNDATSPAVAEWGQDRRSLSAQRGGGEQRAAPHVLKILLLPLAWARCIGAQGAAISTSAMC
ncbi:hypothetical protein [Vreelandella subglaciescola]|jgi:hypothetical protein|uniref:hypothetical protein n=1 Tax=Vreelandella subglaciescola TaxID=29571 RepID=UPI0009A6CAB8|nr:hypothetical protein [Halomonas subglaciescola]